MASRTSISIDAPLARQAVQRGRGLGRTFDVALAAAGLVAALPVLATAAILVLVRDGRPIFFRQSRLGRGGKPFRIWKFRTMVNTRGQGPLVTASNDCRITPLGAILRRYKLDELPQLMNVLAGDMSFVGPRPEVSRYVDLSDPVWHEVLRERPGITDLATLMYVDEEKALAGSADPEHDYRTTLLPRKLSLNLSYRRERTWRSDVGLLLLTLRCSFLSQRPSQDELIKTFLNHRSAADGHAPFTAADPAGTGTLEDLRCKE